MTYQSGAAFRRALEQRLLTDSRQQQLPLVRLRKTVAFERLMAREVGLDCRSLPEAYAEAARFLGPVLQNGSVGVWEPETHSWTALP